MTLALATQTAIHVLWNELADFDATRSDAAREHLLTTLSALIDASSATWIGAVRLDGTQPGDPVNGWRPRVLRHLRPNPRFEQMCKEQVRNLEGGSVDETTLRNVALAGQYRVNRLAELAPPGWFEGDFYRTFYHGIGWHDAIWAGIPVNEDVEVYFGFYRETSQPMFGCAERDIVAAALQPLKWLHRRMLLAEGVGVATAPLSAAERQVLHGLLAGQTQKQIAAALGHSPHTTREYARRIFRKYGVSDGAQLMALWLGR